MSKKDGKAVLLNAVEIKGFYRLHISEADSELNEKAAGACPVRVIEIQF